MRSDLPNAFGRKPKVQFAARAKRPASCAPAAWRGVTLIELAVVIAIALVAMAIATPVMLNTLNASRVRNQMNDLAGVVQMCRSQAVQQNATKEIYFDSSKRVVYVADPKSGTPPSLTTTMAQIWLPGHFQATSAPTSSPAPLTSTTMWGDGLGNTPDTSTNPGDLCFNSRGIPCNCPSTPTAYCSGTGTTTAGYAYYFTLTSQPGGTRWAALGISPAGRIKTFFWDGSSWSD